MRRISQHCPPTPQAGLNETGLKPARGGSSVLFGLQLAFKNIGLVVLEMLEQMREKFLTRFLERFRPHRLVAHGSSFRCGQRSNRPKFGSVGSSFLPPLRTSAFCTLPTLRFFYDQIKISIKDF